MTPPGKRSPAEAWDALQKRFAHEGAEEDEEALRARVRREAARVAELSDEEVAAELRAEGVDPEAVRARAEAPARGATEAQGRDPRVAVAVPQADPRKPEPGPKPIPLRRIAPVWLIAAVFVVLCLVVLAVARVYQPERPPPIPEPSPAPTREVPEESPAMAARRYRDEAKAACDRRDWATCRRRAADAEQADPEGMKEDAVLQAVLTRLATREQDKAPTQGD